MLFCNRVLLLRGAGYCSFGGELWGGRGRGTGEGKYKSEHRDEYEHSEHIDEEHKDIPERCIKKRKSI